MQSQRAIDSRADSESVSPFLDEGFYSAMDCRYGTMHERIRDKERQYRGADVVIHSRSTDLFIDEKVKLNNINNPPSAMAFEISSVQGENIREGWFVKRDMLTTHYLIGCVFSDKKVSKDSIRKEDIGCITASLVTKRDILSFVTRLGLSASSLLDTASKIRTNPSAFRVSENATRPQRIDIANTRDVWITYSPQLSEKPINLVIPKLTLDLMEHTRRFVVFDRDFVQIGIPTSPDILEAKIAMIERDFTDVLKRIDALEKQSGINDGINECI